MPYTRVLVVADDSPAGRRALRAGAEVAAAAGPGAALLPLRVVDEPWAFFGPGEVETKRALRDRTWHLVAREQVSDALRLAVTALPRRPAVVTPIVRFDTPAVDIPRAAQDSGANLIVMDSAAAGVLDEVLLRTRLPCLIVSPEWRGWKRVLVYGDVFREAFAFAGLFRCDVVVADAEPQLATAAAGRGEATAREAFAAWHKVPGTGVFDVLPLHQDPVTGLPALAHAERADLLVLAHRRAADAAVATAIARAAQCDVLLVPA